MSSYTFSPFEFDPSKGRLKKHGLRIKLQQKPQIILRALLERPGQTISRQELYSLLWPQGVHVDFEQGLNVAVKKLRDALSDPTDDARYIATVPGVGYRFIGAVEKAGTQTEDRPGPEAAGPPEGGLDTLSPTSPPREDVPTANHVFQPASATQARFPFSLARAWERGWGWAALLAITFTAIAFLVRARESRLESTNPKVFAVVPLPPGLKLLSRGISAGLAISPDGRYVAFSAMDKDHSQRLWLRHISSAQATPLSGTEGGFYPFWSPDSRRIGFFVQQKLRSYDLDDQTITDLCHADEGRGGTWSPSGDILYASSSHSPIYRVSAKGGTAQPQTRLDEPYTTHRWPVFLPDGKHFVFLAASHRPNVAPVLMIAALDQSTLPRVLTEADSNPAVMGNSLLFVSGGKLLSATLEFGPTEQSLGEAAVLAERIDVDRGSWFANYTAADDLVLYVSRKNLPPLQHVFAWLDASGKLLGTRGDPGPFMSLSLSRDGKTIAAICGDPDMNVCVLRADGSLTQVTSDPINSNVIFAPDGSRIAFSARPNGQAPYLGLKPLNAALPERRIRLGTLPLAPLDWHPDGRHLLLGPQSADTARMQYLDTERGESVWYPAPPMVVEARFSPDGRWFAYVKLSGGEREIHVRSFPESGTDYLLYSGMQCGSPRWQANGEALYYLDSSGRINRVEVSHADRNNLNFGPPRILFPLPYTAAPGDGNLYEVTRDGRRFLVLMSPDETASELLLLAHPGAGGRKT